MKYLKLIENEYEIASISYDSYINFNKKELLLIVNILYSNSIINDEVYNKIKISIEEEKNYYVMYPYTIDLEKNNVKIFSRGKYIIDINKLKDDYFEIACEYDDNVIYYKCDQLSGLKKCLIYLFHFF